MLSVVYWILAGAALVAADQITKYLAVVFLKGREAFEIIPRVLEFYYTTNTGAAFSSFAGRRLFLIIMPLILMTVLVICLLRTKKKGFLLNLSVMMILSGGMGNLIDRILNGYVVDFINFAFINFPIFNLADIFVTCGGALLVIYLIFFADKEKTGGKYE